VQHSDGDSFLDGTSITHNQRVRATFYHLRRALQYQILEHDIVGKSKQFQIEGESERTTLLRFLLHFLFVSHDCIDLELFDVEEEGSPLTAKKKGSQEA